MIVNVLLICLAVVGIVLAGLFAGAETGIYRLSRLRLRLGIEKQHFSYVALGRIMHDSGGLLISILIGTNLSHYLATSLITYLFLRQVSDEHTAEVMAAVVTTPLLFVFSELIPKSLFFYRADTLTPYVAPLLYVFKRTCDILGIAPLLKQLSKFFARVTGAPSVVKVGVAGIHQPHMKAIIQDTQEEGFLSPVQTDILNRLANLSHLSVRAVMVPLNRVEMVSTNCDRIALLESIKRHAYTRALVYDSSHSNIVGFLNIYDCFATKADFDDLRDFVLPIRRLPATTSVIEAMDFMKKENEKIVLIMRGAHGRNRPSGIVTMKDLVEELFGELTEW